jgi:hypothetical protein
LSDEFNSRQNSDVQIANQEFSINNNPMTMRVVNESSSILEESEDDSQESRHNINVMHNTARKAIPSDRSRVNDKIKNQI